MNVDDQTDPKSCYTSDMTGGDNQFSPSEAHCTANLPCSGHDILDSEGNIRSAQKDVNDTNYCAHDRSIFRVDADEMTHLDDSLHGLTKELYISHILDSTSCSEETIVQYRHYLFCKISDQDNQPLGMLKDRRNSPNGQSAAQKYASDCYILQEYSNGNVSDIKNLLKKHMFNQSMSQS